MAITVKCWVVRHKFRDGLYLGKNGEVRDLPLLFAEEEHAKRTIQAVPILLQPDWVPVVVEVRVPACVEGEKGGEVE